MPARIFAICGGKGGVGKTHVAINIAYILARNHGKVLLVDCDLGLANIDIVLGLTPKVTIKNILSGNNSLAESTLDYTENLHILPGVGGALELANISRVQLSQFLSELAILSAQYDYIILDTSAGVDEKVLQFIAHSEKAVLVACPDPASMADCYAQLKLLHQQYHLQRFYLLVNRATSIEEGDKLFAKINKVVGQFLGAVVHPLGSLPDDPLVGKALAQYKPVTAMYPGGPIGRAYHKVIDKLLIEPAVTLNDAKWIHAHEWCSNIL